MISSLSAKLAAAGIALFAMASFFPVFAVQEPQKEAAVSTTPASVLVFNQKADGKTIKLSYTFMPTDGYVVILDDANGKPGKEIASMPLAAGDHRDFKFTFDKDQKAGSKYWVALYEETDHNGKFDDKDKPVWKTADIPLQNEFNIL